MTDCNASTLEFSSLKRQKVVADFAGGQITSDAGALLLREADRRVGLVDAINAVIHDPRSLCGVLPHNERGTGQQ